MHQRTFLSGSEPTLAQVSQGLLETVKPVMKMVDGAAGKSESAAYGAERGMWSISRREIRDGVPRRVSTELCLHVRINCSILLDSITYGLKPRVRRQEKPCLKGSCATVNNFQEVKDGI